MLPGFGVPFVFTRHYRSGIDFQSPLGYGWNHSFGRRLVFETTSYASMPQQCDQPHKDIIYFDERMNRIRFRLRLDYSRRFFRAVEIRQHLGRDSSSFAICETLWRH